MNEEKIGELSLEKHSKYKDSYESSMIYWGMGIENEFYLEFDKKIKFSRDDFLNCHKHERYSLDYYKNYKKELLKEAFELIFFKEELPLMLNSHSFSKTDKYNNSKTLYTKDNHPNPKFTDQTLWEFLEEKNQFIKENYNKSIIFDGDSIEIITINFFNTTLDKVFEELIRTRTQFIENLQQVFDENKIFSVYGKIGLMKNNNPFGIFMTNINNVVMFNNGTLHYNLTLPTLLDEKGKIRDKNLFIKQHKNYIRLIQLFEPFMISVYGVNDPFWRIDWEKKYMFSGCSQRNAISRYIGIGIYDTDLMKNGKILTQKIEEMEVSKLDYWWYKKYYEFCGYNQLDELGFDINFNKHYNLGIEVRIFEHQVDNDKVREIGEFLIYLGDLSYDIEVRKNPIYMRSWNDLVIECMKFGKETRLSDEHVYMVEELIGEKIGGSVLEVYYVVLGWLRNRYRSGGKFSEYIMKGNNLLEREAEKLEINNIKEDIKIEIQELKNEINKINLLKASPPITKKEKCCSIL